MKVLVTGGAGYIGSTICSALKDFGHTPVILDSLVSGKIEFTKGHIFYQGDISNHKLLKEIFSDHPEIEAGIHCAALIVVPESMENPYEYYKENVSKSNDFFRHLIQLDCKKIIFSSSASIYDSQIKSEDSKKFMVTESSFIAPKSPYAKTKFMMEMILEDFCVAYGAQAISLRYFNPIGADPKMRSGAYIKNPTHVLGRLVETALGKIAQFQVTGTHWPTRDGSGIRDYIHVWDLALAHVKAVEEFDSAFKKACEMENGKNHLVINLGTGNGVTVLELVSAFEKVYEKAISKSYTEARPGDVAGCFANADLAQQLLGWKSQFDVEDGIRDALKWAEKYKNF
jgi:UDP-glucose 4-epimerase